MGKSFVLDIKFEGCSEICKLDYDIRWLNLDAMLKCHLDVENIALYYIDDEDDEVCLGCEEELTEAKTVAKKQDDVLVLKIIRKTPESSTPDSSTPESSTPEPAEKTSSGTRAGPVESSDPDITALFRTNPQLPVQCSSRSSSSNISNKPGPYYADLVATAGQLRAKKLQQAAAAAPQSPLGEDAAPTQEAPAVAMAEDAPAAAATAACNTSGGAAGSETAVPEELVERVVRGVLNGLDRAVVDAICMKAPPKVGDQCDGIPAKNVFCHLGIICDNCNKTIVGVRYKCGHCTDYDLCEPCEAAEGAHNPGHVFLKLRQPARKGLGVKPDGRVVPLLKRPIYGDSSSVTVNNSLKRLEEKMVRKAAKAELKRKYREEKRRYRSEARHPAAAAAAISPSKRERLERMAEQQVEEILQAAHAVGGPREAVVSQADRVPDVVAIPQGEKPAEGAGEGNSTDVTKLFMRRKMDAEFVRDGNLPDDTHMQPDTKFIKSWIMRNTGPAAWNHDTKLKLLLGDIATSRDAVAVPPLAPGDQGAIHLEFVAPRQPGRYQSHWRLAQDGELFGHRVWCCIVVDPPSAVDEKKVEDPTQEASSNAVAQLQTDQQDPSIPMRVCSSAEMLTAQDVLSFEMLKISDGNQTETEVAALIPQTTPTPHNTPLGVTPCISPVRELDAIALSRHMSQHSDMQIIEAPTEETETPPGLGAVAVETDCAGTEPDDDVETLSSSETSEDLLDDFEVVPLPDCFDPSKPLDTSTVERKSSVTGTQTHVTLLEPLPFTAKQDACISAVTSCNTVATDVSALATMAHSGSQTSAEDDRRDVASTASPSSTTVGTDVDALCPTAHCEAQTDLLAAGEEPFVHVLGWESPTKHAVVASAECVPTSTVPFLSIASSVTQTESCASQDAATAAAPVSVAVATSVDTLFNLAHTEAQTVPCAQRDAATHAVPSSAAVATDVDALIATAHSAAQTARRSAKDATTATAVPSSATVATDVDALLSASHAHSQTTPSPSRNAATSPDPSGAAAVATDVEDLFDGPGPEVHTEPLVPHQVHSPLQIIKITSPTVTVDTATASASYHPNAGCATTPLGDATDQSPPKIVDITGQLGTNVDATSPSIQVARERDQEEFHDAVEPNAAQNPNAEGAAAPSQPSQLSTDDQDPMEALGFTAQKAMEYAGGIVKQAFGQAAMSVSALLNPQPLSRPQDWPESQKPVTDPVDQLVEMGFGNRQRNKELLKKHNNCVSLCVQELLQEQDDSWHAGRH